MIEQELLNLAASERRLRSVCDAADRIQNRLMSMIIGYTSITNRPRIVAPSDNPWILLERPDSRLYVPARIVRLELDPTSSYVQQFRFDVIDDGIGDCSKCIGVVRRGLMQLRFVPRFADVGTGSVDFGQSTGSPRPCAWPNLRLTETAWQATEDAIRIAGPAGAPYIVWIGELLREKRLAADVLSFLALPSADRTIDCCVSGWRHNGLKTIG